MPLEGSCRGAVSSASEAIAVVDGYFAELDAFKLVLVYGSANSKHFGPSSDVDIAVAGATPLDSDLLLSTQAELSSLLGRSVDLIDLWNVEGLILHRAITGGKRVKTDPGLFVRFNSKALGYREDFLPLERAMRQARIKRFIDGH